MQVRLQQQNTEPAVLSQEKAIQGSRQQNTERAVPLQGRTAHRSMATETEPVVLAGACTESRLFGDRKQNRQCQSGSGQCRSVCATEHRTSGACAGVGIASSQVSWRRQKVIPWRNPFNWGCNGCRSGPARLLVLHIRQLSGASAVAWALTEARVLSEQSLMLQRLTVPGRSWMLRESLGEPDGCGRSTCQHSVHPKPEKPKWEPRITSLVERACKLVLQSIWR